MKLQLKLVDETNVEDDSQVDQEVPVGTPFYSQHRVLTPPPSPRAPVGAEKADRNNLNKYHTPSSPLG